MHCPAMLLQMIRAREAKIAGAPAPPLGAVVALRGFGEVRGGVAGQVVGAGELAAAARVEAVVGGCFGCGGGGRGGGVGTVGGGGERLV